MKRPDPVGTNFCAAPESQKVKSTIRNSSSRQPAIQASALKVKKAEPDDDEDRKSMVMEARQSRIKTVWFQFIYHVCLNGKEGGWAGSCDSRVCHCWQGEFVFCICGPTPDIQ
jgi:hypothetical protein